MINEFHVIGERRDDEEHLLLLGSDGQHYDYHLRVGEVAPTEPDDNWEVDNRDMQETSPTPDIPDVEIS
jgi:hypothetical protein